MLLLIQSQTQTREMRKAPALEQVVLVRAARDDTTRAALAAAFAVGFAVSVAQFLPTLFVGGGRFATVTTEALALSSGGQRSLLAAFALLQWLVPACVFALALWLGRKRRFAPPLTARSLA